MERKKDEGKRMKDDEGLLPSAFFLLPFFLQPYAQNDVKTLLMNPHRATRHTEGHV